MNFADVLNRAEARLHAFITSKLKKMFVEYGVPNNRSMGIRIERVDLKSGEVTLKLKNRKRNQNVGGTIHGGVIVALAETVHGVAVLWRFSPFNHIMVSREIQIHFFAPGRGVLRSHFQMTPSVLATIVTELKAKNRCDIELASLVTDESGKEIAKLIGKYVIKRKREKRCDTHNKLTQVS